ncbi:MAG: ATP-binding cassette subfamily F protein uup, partial [Chitinophagales bacterium]
MQYLQVENVSKRYGEKLLFENISFLINRGEKVALVAANGTGKSSLIRAIAGIESADSGNINFARGVRVEYLMQEPEIDEKLSILENVLFADNPASKAILSYEKALANPEDAEGLSNSLA